MKTKKEKMYDFGMLGKWSEKTLLEQLYLNEGCSPKVNAISLIEKELRKEHDKRIAEEGKTKIKEFKTIKDLFDRLTILVYHQERIREISRASNKAYSVLCELYREKKKQDKGRIDNGRI